MAIKKASVNAQPKSPAKKTAPMFDTIETSAIERAMSIRNGDNAEAIEAEFTRMARVLYPDRFKD